MRHCFFFLQTLLREKEKLTRKKKKIMRASFIGCGAESLAGRSPCEWRMRLFIIEDSG
jgi:hypothetical protein